MSKERRELSGMLYRVSLLRKQLAEAEQRLTDLEQRHGVKAGDAIALRSEPQPKVA